MATIRPKAWGSSRRTKHACRVRRVIVGPPPGSGSTPRFSSHRSRLARGDRDRRDAPASGSALGRGLGLNCPTNAPVQRRGERQKKEMFAGSEAERLAETRNRYPMPTRRPPRSSKRANAPALCPGSATRLRRTARTAERTGEKKAPHVAGRRRRRCDVSANQPLLTSTVRFKTPR